jgi:hypothetical protein
MHSLRGILFEFQAGVTADQDPQRLYIDFSHTVFYFSMIKYFRLIAIINLVYIIVFTLHIFNF